MNFFTVFQQRSRYFIGTLIVLGWANSLLFSGILIFINHAISQEPIPFLAGYDWLVFIGLLLFSMVVNGLFETFIIRLTNNILYDLELSVLQKVRKATYQVYEKFGADKIYTAISDTRVLASLPESFVNFINSSILVACVLAYLFYISPAGGLCTLLLMVLLLIFYLVRNNSIEKDLNEVRDLQNEYQQFLRDLLLGFREVKMSEKRNEQLFTRFMQANRAKVRKLSIKSGMRYMSNELVGRYSWYVVLGVILFVFPRYLNLKINEIASFLVAILYLIGPVATLIMIFPAYTRSKISLQRIKQLHDEIDGMVKEPVAAKPLQGPFQKMVFENVVFEYAGDGKNTPFRVGPINLTIQAGELIFITGGNGSGKSTFINILTGLYQPASGTIYVNDKALAYADFSFFSHAITAIFTDNYLFSQNYDDFDLQPSGKDIQAYSGLLKMTDVLQFNTESNSLDHRLSKGQRKRLALIYSLMENREIMVLDEWAAEQDPEFRDYFYHDIIPRLKDMGKTVIAVTHDDRFFSCAERVIKLDYGTIEKETIVIRTSNYPKTILAEQ